MKCVHKYFFTVFTHTHSNCMTHRESACKTIEGSLVYPDSVLRLKYLSITISLLFHTQIRSHCAGECLTLSPAITLPPSPPPCGIRWSPVCSNITPEPVCQPLGSLIARSLASAQEKAFT